MIFLIHWKVKKGPGESANKDWGSIMWQGKIEIYRRQFAKVSSRNLQDGCPQIGQEVAYWSIGKNLMIAINKRRDKLGTWQVFLERSDRYSL